jgi:hypothetical protein
VGVHGNRREPNGTQVENLPRSIYQNGSLISTGAFFHGAGLIQTGRAFGWEIGPRVNFLVAFFCWVVDTIAALRRSFSVMAHMHPVALKEKERATAGEKRVFHFVKAAAGADPALTCWYRPIVGQLGDLPGFLILERDLGLILVGVKDWRLDQIVAATPLAFTIRVSETAEKMENPDRELKRWEESLKNALEGILKPPAEPSAERWKIPFGRMVVFPNIREQGYRKRGLQWLIPPERVLFEDDLEPKGEILSDPTGKRFKERLSGFLPSRSKGLRGKDLERLAFFLGSGSKIFLPPRGQKERESFRREIRSLDGEQARLALRLQKGHQIIKGPPGSGKTLLLVHRCSQLLTYKPGARVLLVCYNIALVSYLKRLLQERGLRVGEKGIHVYHFFELCSHVLVRTVHFENEDSQYYDRVTEEAVSSLAKKKSALDPFDAIYVDEGQDFNHPMLKVLLSLLRPEGELVISLDSYQDLYRRRGSWKSWGIRAGGRTYRLERVYRNTSEISQFTRNFLGDVPERRRQLALLPRDFSLHGPWPEMRRFRSQEEVEAFITKDLSKQIEQGRYRRSEIAIIYDDKIYGPDRFGYGNRSLPMRLLRKLEDSGIPAAWVSRDAKAKALFDMRADRVALISIHSSKGLDFDLVCLVGADRIRPSNRTRKDLITLVYVAMTRAKYRLVIPYVEETELIQRMKSALPEETLTGATPGLPG